MDLQIALLSVGVCALSAVVVYLISVFGMREKTYEEAIEEQRKRNQEAAQHSKVEKPKKEKKFKKQGKRVKESRNSEEETEQPSSNHIIDHVDFKPDAEIIPTEPDPENKPQKSKKKVKAPKSILLNKQDVGPISTDLTSTSDDDKDVLDAPPAFVPMDEVERRHSLDIGQKKLANLLQNSIPVSEVPAPIPEDKPNTTEIKVQQPEFKVQAQHEVNQEKKPEEPKKNRKQQRTDSSENESELSFKKLMSTIKKLALVDEEIQTLIDVLLNKQQGGSEWHKKNDPVATLKKQLAEKEAALEGEQRSSQTVNNKLREVRQELTQEKSRLVSVERTLRQELQATHTRLQAAIDQQNKTQQVQSKANEEHSLNLQCLKEEKLSLQKQIQLLEVERQKCLAHEQEIQRELERYQAHSKANEEHVLNLQRLNEEKVSLQQQLKLAEVERQKWGAREKDIQREIEERYQATLVQEQERMGLQLQSKESQLQQLLAAQEEGDFHCTQALSELKQQLQEAQAQRLSLSQELEAERSTVRQRLEHNEMVLHQRDEELQRIKRIADEERLKLQGQVKNANNQKQDFERQLGILQEEVKNLHQQLTCAQQQKESMEALGGTQNAQLQQEKNLLATRLAETEESLQKFQTDLTEAHSEVEAQKSKNNELRERNWKAMDALSTLERTSKEKEQVQAKELGILQQAKEEAMMQLHEQQQKLQELMQKEKNPSPGGISQEQLQRIQEDERACLQRLLPDAQVDSALEHSTWIERFLEHVQERLSANSSLSTEKSSLVVQVSHYQTVLSDTENMLKNLQNKVEDQENVWAERLARQETETQKVLEEKRILEDQLQQLQGLEEATAEMQGRLKELQAKLQGEESDRKQIESKAEEAFQQCATLTSELEGKKQELERLQKEAESLDRLTSQVNDLQKDLEKERKITKELGSQVVKLNSLVKIGQDALKAEQELVKQLQNQLAPCSNGNNNNNNNSINKIPTDNGTAVENEGASGKK